jgi:hypothetical protein
MTPMHAPTLSSSLPTPLAEREIQLQIQQALNNKLTGQILITFLNDRTESIFVHQGKVRGVYIRNHRVPDLNWEAPLKRFGRGTLEIEPMPMRALMFKKVILEELTPDKPQASGTNQLATMFNLAEFNLPPTLFHIQWDHAEGLVLIAGKNIPIRHAILLTESITTTEPSALGQILTWEEAQCNVTVYHGDIKNQAWLEIHLNILLEWYCQNILNYYKQLTGVVMVKSVLQGLAMLAERKGWNISTQDQQLKDTTLFLNAAETANAYREILSALKVRIEPVVGSSLTNTMLKQSTEPIRGVYKTIQETFGLIEDVL